jgi:MerR family transcriptional regulator, light-induced transcriptional regulator
LSKYRIQHVAQMTGLSPAVIRAWEARYRLVVPQRSDAGYRLYSDEDVAVLRAAGRLASQGMAPMQIAALGRGEILAGGAAGAAAAPVVMLDAEPEPPTPGPILFGGHIHQIVDAFVAFDRARVEALLSPALATLPPDMACDQLLIPLLREVGDRWHGGQVSVAAEHFGSSIVRGKLLAILETLRHRSGGRRVVCACPPGEWHEIGLMMFAMQAAAQGWEVVYLGANLPLEGLSEAADRPPRPDLVALSVAQRHDPAALRQLLAAARAAVPADVPLLVGGRGLAGREELGRQAGALLLPPSGRLADLL